MQIGYSGCAHTAPLRGRLATESRVDAPLIVAGSKSAQLAPQVNTAPEEDLIKVVPPHHIRVSRYGPLVMTPATGSNCGFFLPSVKYFWSCPAARSGSRCTKPLVYFLAVNGHIPGSGEAEAYLAVSYPEHGDGHSFPDL